jgi:hypothetical protein
MTDVHDRRRIEQEHADSLSEEELADMVFDGDCEAADGCYVDPDGTCEHGYRSPLRVLGLI